MAIRNSNTVALAALALAVAACGGDSSGGGSAAVSTGAIRSFGSVHVNGVEWKVSGATLVLDDGQTQSLSTEDSIRAFAPQGSVVTVKGRRDGATGTATQIEFKSIIEGPIAAKTDAGFTIAGLNVSIDASTKFFDSAGTEISYASLTAGQRVEVSGLPESGTSLHASMVRAKTGNQVEFEAKGYVVGLSGSSFGISLVSGGSAYLNVNASGATLPSLANGSIVEVKGTSFAPGTPGTLTATLVELEDRLLGDDNSEAEIEGIIVGFDGANSFVVAGQPVSLTASTRFVGAADPSNPRADLADGTKVEVEGQLQGGTLVAEQVKYKDAVRIMAPVTTVSGSTFTMLGKSVAFAASRTRFDGLTAPSIGQALEIRGYVMIDGTIFAQRVKLEDGGNDRPFLQGVVTSKTPTSSLTVLGITVNTDSSTEFHDSSETLLSATNFFNAVTEGQTLVKAKWDVGTTDTSLPARELELEGEDD